MRESPDRIPSFSPHTIVASRTRNYAEFRGSMGAAAGLFLLAILIETSPRYLKNPLNAMPRQRGGNLNRLYTLKMSKR
jgi:hypothetical protein